MTDALHLRHLDLVWAADGPLQASLRLALTGVAILPKAAGPLLKSRGRQARTPAGREAVIALLENTIEANIQAVDRLRGDPDFEPDADGERSLGWTAGPAGAWDGSSAGDLED